MSATLYEQFFAVGSVKSLLTGKEILSPEHSSVPIQDNKQQKQPDTSGLTK